MEKEFEALQKFLDDYLALCEKLHTNRQEKMLLDENSPYNVLKQALTELKAIKEAKPSEAMNELNEIIEYITEDKAMNELNEIIEYITEDKKVKYKATILFDCEIIKDALLKAQEQEKENQELKKKISSYERNIEIYASKQLETDNFYLRNENAEYKEVLRIIFEKNVDINYLKYNTLHDYNCHILARDRLDTKNQLTEEEFDLLKRWSEK